MGRKILDLEAANSRDEMTTESEAKAKAKSTGRKQQHPLVEAARNKDILSTAFLYRLVNAFLLFTFFQPDEFYQAQEPAWKLAFGRGDHAWRGGAYVGPWITWEWENKLRSSIYPILLGSAYKVVDVFADFLLPPVLRTFAMLFTPKVVGATSAALTEYFTWRLGERIFGQSSIEATAVLYLSAVSPWQWFVSTRTFSNCLETTLTVIALSYWPWSWFKTTVGSSMRRADRQRLVYAFTSAGVASVLRPTNVLIWITLALMTIPQASRTETFAMLRTGAFTGFLVLVSSAASDYLYYGELTFPPLNFITFNIGKNIADFYGTMRVDYYFTEGIPLLLTTALPFTLLGLYQALSGRNPAMPAGANSDPAPTSLLRTLALTALAVPTAFSFISHKEVRFIYPMLPILFILTARPVVRFFHPLPSPSSQFRKLILGFLLSINVIIALYLGMFHGAGIVGAQRFLRQEHERLNPSMSSLGRMDNITVTSAAFLMPCHSVPWRSNLVYKEIEAWQLTCDPPLNMTAAETAVYKDEADIFYEDPVLWMRGEFGGRKRFWPMYVVFFDPLTKEMKETVAEGSYVEVWRGFNSLAHDDWRRRGDVVIWARTKAYGGPG